MLGQALAKCRIRSTAQWLACSRRRKKCTWSKSYTFIHHLLCFQRCLLSCFLPRDTFEDLCCAVGAAAVEDLKHAYLGVSFGLGEEEDHKLYDPQLLHSEWRQGRHCGAQTTWTVPFRTSEFQRHEIIWTSYEFTWNEYIDINYSYNN